MLDIKNCSCEKCLIGKLVLEFTDDVLNTTVNLLNDKKGKYTAQIGKGLKILTENIMYLLKKLIQIDRNFLIIHIEYSQMI